MAEGAETRDRPPRARTTRLDEGIARAVEVLAVELARLDDVHLDGVRPLAERLLRRAVGPDARRGLGRDDVLP